MISLRHHFEVFDLDKIVFAISSAQKLKTNLKEVP